jgi:hypothetical protein
MPPQRESALKLLTQTELVDIFEGVKLADWNPQIHDRQNLSAIKRSIKEFGFVVPILIRASDRLVIGGHGRILAARNLYEKGYSFEGEQGRKIPALVGEWDDTTAKALNIALNKIQSRSDPHKLGDLVDWLSRYWDDERLRVTGLDLEDLQSLRNITTASGDFKQRLIERWKEGKDQVAKPYTNRAKWRISEETKERLDRLQDALLMEVAPFLQYLLKEADLVPSKGVQRLREEGLL